MRFVFDDHWCLGTGRVAATILLALFTASCSGSGDPAKVPTGDQPAKTYPYSIKMYVDKQGKRELIEVPPIDSIVVNPNRNKLKPATAVNFGNDAGSVSVDTNQIDDQSGFYPGWTILREALNACSTEIQQQAVQSGRQVHFGFNFAVPPWNPGAFFAFQPVARNTISSCDAALAAQEQMLCAANKLAEIADTVTPIEWDSVPDFSPDVEGEVKVTIPPQANKDKFIVRDMAINVLAHIARLEVDPNAMTLPPSASPTCTEAYNAAPVDNSVFADSEGLYFPPLQVSLADNTVERFRAERLLYKAHILRGAERLLRDVLEKSVDSDLAGSEKQRALAADPVLGAQVMWGARGGSDTPYNSLRHALRLLFGRWELSKSPLGRLVPFEDEPPGWTPGEPSLNDPSCSGFETFNPVPLLERVDPDILPEEFFAHQDLMDALGPGFDARWHIRSATTSGQSLAASTLASAAIVIAPDHFQNGDLKAVKDAIVEQLQLNLAQQQGIKSTTASDWMAFLQTPIAAGVASVMNQISDADLRFGLERIYDELRLLRDSAGGGIGAGSSAGVTVLTTSTTDQAISPKLVAVQGGVVAGGFPQSDLTVDVMGRMGAAQSAAQCIETSTAIDFPMNPDLGIVSSFQNSFVLGDNFRRWLALIRDSSQGFLANGGDANTIQTLRQAVDLTSLATAETRAWAASARVHVEDVNNVQVIDNPDTGESSTQVTARKKVVTITGMSPQDLGVATPTEMLDQVFMVYGPPWVAECAARLRKSCPPNFDTTYVRAPLVKQLAKDKITNPSVWRGVDGIPLYFEFDVSPEGFAILGGSEPNEPPAFGQPPENVSFHYLIARHDPAFANNKGRVIAALSDSQYGSVIDQSNPCFSGPCLPKTEVMSDLQRQLANRVFGLTAPGPDPSGCLSGISPSSPADHCVGIPRNAFVPLANELTSTSGSQEDSWKHYLSVADDAATHADELGKQLFDLELQQDLRREAAQEQLGQMCGTYADLTNLKTTAGKVDVSSEDDTVKACLDPQLVDFVFLGTDPYANMSDADATAALKKRFCTTDSQEPVCTKTDPISHKGLGIVQEGGVSGFDSAPCQDPIAVFQSIEPGFNHDRAIALGNADWVQPDAVTSVFADLHLLVGDDGATWTLTKGAEPILANYATVPHRTDKPDDTWVRNVYPVCASSTPLQCVRADGSVGPCKCVEQGNVVPCNVCAGTCANGHACSSDADCCTPDPMNPDKCTGEDAKCGGAAISLRQLFELPSDHPNPTAVLHQLEQTLWIMGMFAGSIPDGVIQMPLPVANNLSGQQPYPAVYGDATHTCTDPAANVPYPCSINDALNAGEFRLIVDNSFVNTDDRNQLGTAKPMTTAFAQSRLDQTNGEPLPQWLTDLYHRALVAAASGNGQSTVQYLTVGAANGRIYFQTPDGGNAGPIAKMLQFLTRVSAATAANPDFIGTDPIRVLAQGEAHGFNFGDPSLAIPGFRNVGAPQTGKQVNPIFMELQGPNPEFALPILKNIAIFVDEHMLEFPFSKPVEQFPFAFPLDKTARPIVLNGVSGTIALMTDPCLTATNGVTFSDMSFLRAPNCLYGTFGWQGFFTVKEPQAKGDTVCTGCTIDTNGVAVTGLALRPTASPPSQRLELFMNHALSIRPYVIAKNVTRAMGLSCLLRDGSMEVLPTIDEPPSVQSVEQMTDLQKWIRRQAQNVDKTLSLLYLRSVPLSAVQEFKNGAVDAGAVGQGTYGRLLLDLGSQMRGIFDQWVNAGSALKELSNAIGTARLGIEAANITKRADLKLAAQNFEIDRQVAHRQVQDMRDAFNAVTGVAAGIIDENPFAILSTAGNEIANLMDSQIDNDYFAKIRDNLSAMADNATDAQANQVARALSDLAASGERTYPALNGAVSGIKNQTALALGSINSIRGNVGQASFEIAKAAGADYATIDGTTPAPMPVNTLLRRQYDITKQRYDRALDTAKRAAYVARLSIEQRIGVRLNDLAESVGPIPPPRSWADTVCTMQGIDYHALASTPSLSNGQPTVPGTNTPANPSDAVVGQFADQFIGDYVNKLKEFVEFYNIQYPFREADDTAVLSVRDDLVGPQGICSHESRNLLFYSDALDHSLAQDANKAIGWRTNPCVANVGKCLRVSAGAAMTDPPDPPGGFGGVTWLHEVDPSMLPSGAALDVAPDPAAALNVVFQQVDLQAGAKYMLSWWDMARDLSTGGAATDPQDYRVTVYTDDWTPVATQIYTAHPGPAWSPQRELDVEPFANGTYRVAFSSSVLAAAKGSVAIANVQLEEPSTTGIGDFRYEQTTNSRTVFSTDCIKGDPVQFRNAFTYRCENGQCFHELTQPFVINTVNLNNGNSRLIGKVAAGNFNFRNVSIAMNLVGTGIIDCTKSPTPDCFGSAYVEFDLEHSAFDVPVIDYQNAAHCFTFGVGAINRGKALASERFITIPLSSADQALLSQPEFTKPEFFGRPLDGTYRLRIVDKPSLAWQKVEDIQLILDYRYWSRISRGPSSP